jgi:hypothetical protein
MSGHIAGGLITMYSAAHRPGTFVNAGTRESCGGGVLILSADGGGQWRGNGGGEIIPRPVSASRSVPHHQHGVIANVAL